MENEGLSVTNRKIELDALIDELKDDEHSVYCGTDASLPANIRHQAASAEVFTLPHSFYLESG